MFKLIQKIYLKKLFCFSSIFNEDKYQIGKQNSNNLNKSTYARNIKKKQYKDTFKMTTTKNRKNGILWYVRFSRTVHFPCNFSFAYSTTKYCYDKGHFARIR